MKDSKKKRNFKDYLDISVGFRKNGYKTAWDSSGRLPLKT
jgi:hypothetical protein